MQPVLGSAKPSPGNPLLARFGTPDPMTENPFSTQGWNRYSYVGNSPVNYTDPSGYCFMGCFWKPVFKAIGNFLRENWRAIVQIAATALCVSAGALSHRTLRCVGRAWHSPKVPRDPVYTAALTATTERSSARAGPRASAGWCEPHGHTGVKVAREPCGWRPIARHEGIGPGQA